MDQTFLIEHQVNAPGWQARLGWRRVWTVSMIVLLGFGLRALQLGHDIFWNDKAGVALTAVEPTVRTVLSRARSHAMAMPLDYIVTWAMPR